MYTLVVVDMQPLFKTSQNEATLNKCKELIEQAVKDDAGIVFLEFYGYDKTDPRLMAAVEGYKQAHFESKFVNDGSAQVLAAVKNNGLDAEVIKVCGVNTNYCVRETVLGLLYASKEHEIAKKIQVSMNGTNCSFYHLLALETISLYENCELID